MNRSGPTLAVLRLLDQADRGECGPVAKEDGLYGFAIARRLGLRSGTLYPMLRRLRQAEFVDERQPIDDMSLRKYYTITEAGRAFLNARRSESS